MFSRKTDIIEDEFSSQYFQLSEERKKLKVSIKNKVDTIKFLNRNPDNIENNIDVLIINTELYKKTPVIVNGVEVGYGMSVFQNKETTVTFFELTENIDFPQHFHEYVETIVCTYGKMRIVFTNGDIIHLESSDALKIQKGILHQVSILKNCGCIALFKPKLKND